MTYTVEKHADEKAWLKARVSAIGASDAACLWGTSTYRSAYAMAFSKIYPDDGDDGPDIVARVGKALEPLVADLFTEATGVKTTDPGDYTIYRRADLPFVACTPDRLTADGEAVVELKTAHFGAAAEWKERIPVGYQVQLQHQMLVLGVRKAYIAVLMNSTTFNHHTMDLSPRFERQHLAKCVAFWRTYIERRELPPVDYSSATARALAKQWMDAKPKVIDLPTEFDSLGTEYDEINATIGQAERRKAEIQNRVKAVLQDNAVGRLGDFSGFRWTGTNGARRFARVERVNDE